MTETCEVYWNCRCCSNTEEYDVPISDVLDKEPKDWNIHEGVKELIENRLCKMCNPLYILVPSRN